MFRFTLLGFPVTVHWMFWAITAMLGANLLQLPRGYAFLMLWVLAAFVSVLIHELGHTLLQRKFGARAEIVLYSMGGLAIPDRGFSRGQHILISLAGPALQMAVGFAAEQLMKHSTGDAWYIREFFDSFAWISFWWGILNLLPIYPLDGGQILKGVLGPSRERQCYLVGMLCAAGLCIYLLTRPDREHYAWSAMLCGLFGFDNFQRWQGRTPPAMLEPR